MKYLALFTIICIILLSRQANGQDFHDYNVLSLDGSNQKIGLNYNEVHETLKLSLLKDSLCVYGVSYLDTVITLNSQFLLVHYGIRGGSGIHVKRALLICVKNDKLFQSLDITSVFNEEFIDFSKQVDTLNPVDRKTVYECKLTISGNDIHDYKLNALVHREKKLKEIPSQYFSSDQTFKLNFDPIKNIFFNSVREVSQYFNVFSEKTVSESRQYFLGKPAITLGDFKYYYNNDAWYEQQQPDYLITYTHR